MDLVHLGSCFAPAHLMLPGVQDTMISDYDIVEGGPGEQRCQVVHWLRTFPFSFISQREYVIGRRVWQEDGVLYGITKSVNHPHAPAVSGIVRMDVFYSMWRSRTIPDHKDPSRPACETVLLHHEQFKIPENLSRFAVRHGMAGFVKKMGPAVTAFVAARRLRVDSVCTLRHLKHCCSVLLVQLSPDRMHDRLPCCWAEASLQV